MKQPVTGFTLIELIVVLGILSIAAALAYPRFIMIEEEARVALVESLGGSVSSAASQAHYLWLLQGKPGTIAMEGETITMLNGYPNDASIDNTLMDYSGFQFRTNPKPVRFRRTDATQPNNCAVFYVQAPAGQRPSTTIETSGC